MQETTLLNGPKENEILKEAIERATVTALYYYPIKSCAGTAVGEAQTTARGFLHDRELMLVEANSGEFLTQRELPKMALIKPQILDEVLQATAPGMPELAVSLSDKNRLMQVKIWKDWCESVDQGDEAASWFSEYLKTDCRVVRMSPDYVRRVDPNYAINASDQVSFADGFAFLLISEESLDDLNRRMDEPFPMNRFRPNIVLSGSGIAFAEDYVKRIVIGEVVMNVVKDCARCSITTNDQQTATFGKEPLRTLATFRRIPRGVVFGQNLIHENNGLLKVGDSVKVLQLK